MIRKRALRLLVSLSVACLLGGSRPAVAASPAKLQGVVNLNSLRLDPSQGRVGYHLSALIKHEGCGPTGWNFSSSSVEGELPPGLQISMNQINGTPRQAGMWRFRIRLTGIICTGGSQPPVDGWLDVTFTVEP